MVFSPDHRFVTINTNPSLAKSELELRFVSIETTPDTSIQYAFDIYLDDYKSEVLEAFLLAKATSVEIEEMLRVPRQVTDIYKSLFFDLGVFKDELDIEAYAQTYDESDFGKQLKICAITLGLDYLRYRFGRGKHKELSMVDALQSMIETGYILSKATKLNPLDSNAAREARQWMMSTIKAMEAFVKVKPATEAEGDTDFKLILMSIDKTTDELKEPSIPKLEIVH